MSPLAKRFRHAVQWSVAISFGTIAIQLGITAIVARILVPSDFGLYAIANVAVAIARNIGERALVSAIVREPALDDEVFGSAVLLSVLFSLVLSTLGVLLAPLASMNSAAAEGDVLEGLCRLMSISILVSGISAPAQAIMQRELRFREIGFVQFAGIAFGNGATTIVLAFAGFGPWSLAFGDMVNATILSAGCCLKTREQWAFSWRLAHVIRLGLIGVQMTILRVLDVLWNQIPLLVSYARLSSFDVGLYQRSQSIVEVGVNYTSGRVTAVLFPVIASRQGRDELLREIIPPLTGLYCLYLFSVAAYVAVMAPDIIAVVLGPKWTTAAVPLVFIMIAFASLHVSQPAGIQLEARAAFKWRIISACFSAVSMVACSLALVGTYGLIGIAIAAVISGGSAGIINTVAIVRDLRIAPRIMIVWLLPGCCVAGLITGALMACNFLLLDQLGSSVTRIALTVPIAILVFVSGFRLFIGERKREMLASYVSPGMSRSALLVAKILGFGGCTS
jgi:lipopolysaccharide exporter